MRLLPLDYFEPLFGSLSGKTVGIVDGFGNVGDDLLYLATRQLCQEFNIEYFTINPLADLKIKTCDKILLFAGGNIGYEKCIPIRQAAYKYNIPCWLLPQSVIRYEELNCEKLFFRETVSRDIIGKGIIVPDLALGFDFPDFKSEVREEGGLFLRKMGGCIFDSVPIVDRKDPAMFCYTPQQYWDYASKFNTVITDRLHFAICSIAMGCKTTLLPVNYHKNKAMHKEWLDSLGCYWQEIL